MSLINISSISTNYNLALEFDDKHKYKEAKQLYELCLQQFQFLLAEIRNSEGSMESEPQLLSMVKIIQRIDTIKDRLKLISKYIVEIEKKHHETFMDGNVVIEKPQSKSTPSFQSKTRQDSEDSGEYDGLISRLEKQCIQSKHEDLSWDDVIGLEMEKKQIEGSVELINTFGSYINDGLRQHTKGILCFGPPGTGKSFLAQIAASRLKGYTYIKVESSQLINKYQGESERLVAALYKMIEKHMPAIVFIDEIDSLIVNRSSASETSETSRRVMTTFLQEIDKCNTKPIIHIGATNTPWDLDDAFRRRFSTFIYIGLPNETERYQLFRKYSGIDSKHNHEIDATSKYRYNISRSEFASMAKKTNHYSPAEIKTICNGAINKPLYILMKTKMFTEVESKYKVFEPEKDDESKTIELTKEQIASLLTENKIIEPVISASFFEEEIKKLIKTSTSESEMKFKDWLRLNSK
jgi:vacuolar protein-sorting-associated protein 4